MTRLDKITRIKFTIFILYYFTFFMPIYSQIVFGTQFKASVAELGAGTFFLIFYFILIIATIVLKLLFQKYFKYSYLVTVGFMILLFLVLLLFKDESATLRLTWYFQAILIGVLMFAHFKEETTLNIFDKILKRVLKYYRKLNSYIKGFIVKRKKHKNNEHEGNNNKEEGDSK